MVNTTTTLANQYQRYLSNELVAHAIDLLVYDQGAQVRPLPRGKGAKGIRFFRKEVAKRGNVSLLQEGVPLANFRQINFTPIDVDLSPYGEAARISDIASWTALVDEEKEIIGTLGEENALMYDGVIRDAIIVGTTAAPALQKKYPRALATRDFATLAAASKTGGKLTVVDILDEVISLRKNKAMPFKGGTYLGMLSPEGVGDIMNDTTWINVKSYSDKTDLYRGEIGNVYGMRLIYGTQPWTESSTGTEGTYVEDGDIAVSIFVGKDAYGTVEMAGMKAKSPRVMISRGPDKSDALDQLTIVGWKAFFAALTINPAFGHQYRHKNTFS